MQTKMKQYQDLLFEFARRFQDVKFAGMMLFLVVVLLISWSGVKAIQSNYELQQQIAQISQQNQVQALTNTNLKLENEYYNTDTYLDLSARQNFGLAAPGEKEIVVPKQVALSYTVPLPAPKETVEKPIDKQPVWQQNFEEWVNFFMHRGVVNIQPSSSAL